jgi:hypothetical protein
VGVSCNIAPFIKREFKILHVWYILSFWFYTFNNKSRNISFLLFPIEKCKNLSHAYSCQTKLIFNYSNLTPNLNIKNDHAKMYDIAFDKQMHHFMCVNGFKWRKNGWGNSLQIWNYHATSLIKIISHVLWIHPIYIVSFGRLVLMIWNCFPKHLQKIKNQNTHTHTHVIDITYQGKSEFKNRKTILKKSLVMNKWPSTKQSTIMNKW